MTSILDQITPDQEIVIDPEKDYLPDLVGEGKTYKTEKDLARAVIEKESFIKRTTRENAELREDLKASRATKRLEDMLDQLQKLQTQQTPSNNDNQPSEPEPKGPQQITPESVIEILNKRDELKLKEKNRDVVTDKLISRYGDNYVSKVKETANQLRVSPEYLDNLAVSNPQIFFKVMGLEEQPKPEVEMPTLPRSGMSFAPSSSGKKDWDYYEKMRKSEPTRYHSIRIQNEMHTEAQKAFKEGRDFYAAS